MKFKKGDTVYLKAKVDKVMSGGFEIGYGFHRTDYNLEILGAEDFIDTDESPIYTKQEMLEELQRPELPKVGEVWREQHGCHAKIMCLSEDNIFFEFQDRLNSPGSLAIKEFLERFKKVES